MTQIMIRRSRTLACAVVALSLVAFSAGAQALDRSKRPDAPPAAAFKFPHVTTKALASAL